MNTLPGKLLLFVAFHQVGALVLAPEPTYPAQLSARAVDDIKAIIPSTSGQIGINPVINDLGDPSTYVGAIIGVDTKWITLDTATVTTTTSWLNMDVGLQWLTYEEEVEDVSTAWINKNTQWLTLETINPTSTSTVQIIAATATAAADGQSIGDVSIIMSEGLANALDKSVKDAVAACKVPGSRMHRRDPASVYTICLATAGAIAVADGGFFETFVNSAEWEEIKVGFTEALEALIRLTVITLSKIERIKMGIWMAAAAVATKIIYDSTQLAASIASGPIAKINIPAAGVGFTPDPSPTVNSCKTQPTKNAESPLCIDFDCLSSDNKICDVEPHIYCPCLLIMPYIAQTGNVSMMYLAQTLIQNFVDSISMQTEYPSTGCATSTITYAASASLFAGETQTFCDCTGIIDGLDYGVSGTVTTSWCNSFESMPAGFTKTRSPFPVTTATPEAPSTTLPPPTSSPPLPPPDSTTTTADPGEPYSLTCGAPFC